MDFDQKFDDDQQEEKGTSFFQKVKLSESGRHIKKIS